MLSKQYLLNNALSFVNFLFIINFSLSVFTGLCQCIYCVSVAHRVAGDVGASPTLVYTDGPMQERHQQPVLFYTFHIIFT